MENYGLKAGYQTVVKLFQPRRWIPLTPYRVAALWKLTLAPLNWPGQNPAKINFCVFLSPKNHSGGISLLALKIKLSDLTQKVLDPIGVW